MAGFSEERFRDVVRGRRAIKVYPLPSGEGTIGLRLVADQQYDDARAAAAAYMKKVGVDLTVDPEFFDHEVTRQVLLRACFDPETIDENQPTPFFADVDQIKKLDTRFVEALASLYQEHADWVAPLRSLDEEQTKKFIEALKKGPAPEAYFSGFEHSTLVRLLISLARSLPS